MYRMRSGVSLLAWPFLRSSASPGRPGTARTRSAATGTARTECVHERTSATADVVHDDAINLPFTAAAGGAAPVLEYLQSSPVHIRSSAADSRCLPFCFLASPLGQAGSPAVSVACLAGGDDRDAVMGGIFEVEKPEQGRG
jgi:hypothetical protein